MMFIGSDRPSGSHKTAIAKRLEKAHGFTRIHAGRPVKNAVRAFELTKAQTDGDCATHRQCGSAVRRHATSWRREATARTRPRPMPPRDDGVCSTATSTLSPSTQ